MPLTASEAIMKLMSVGYVVVEAKDTDHAEWKDVNVVSKDYLQQVADYKRDLENTETGATKKLFKTIHRTRVVRDSKRTMRSRTASIGELPELFQPAFQFVFKLLKDIEDLLSPGK